MSRLATVLSISVACLLIAGTILAQSYTAVINGAQEVPPNASPALGNATMTLDAAKMLSFNITYAGLTGVETSAHFHGPAPVGANAGVQFGLPAGQPKNGVVGPLAAQQEADLNNGLWYINIHTTVFGGGEIRGQVLLQTLPTENTTWGAIKALYGE